MADGTDIERRNDPDLGTLNAEAPRIGARPGALEPNGGPSEATPKKPERRGHRFWAAVLLVLGFLLTPITIVVLFAHTEITDTGRYVATVKPLARDPAVQRYTADRVTTRLFENVDVNQYVKQALPDRAQVLAGPLTSALRSFTHEATLRVLQSNAFQTLWVEANRGAHRQINNLLTGSKSGTVSANSNGAVTVDLSAVAQRVKQRLEDTGIGVFSKIPVDKVSGKVTIFQSKELYKVRRGYRALNRIAFVLPFLVFGSFAGAIFLSKNRRRGFVKAAVAFTLGGLVLAALLSVARGAYLGEATSNGIPHDAAATVYDTFVRLLQTSVRSVLAFSIGVVVVAVLAGPSRLAVWFRTTVRRGVLWAGRQSDAAGWTVLGPIALVVAHKRGMRIAVGAVAFAVLFLWDRPTPMVVFWLAVLAVVMLALIEFFGREQLSVGGAAPAGP